MNAALKTAGRLAKCVAIAIFLPLSLFLLTAWIGSMIPRGSIAEEPIANPVTIMVETNGVHTQFVLPIANGHKDWRETFPSANEWLGAGEPTHVAIGFGDRQAMMEIPQISDLSLSSALRIGTIGGPGVIRVSRYINPPLERDRREIRITGAQYAALVKAIEADLPPLGADPFRDYERDTFSQDAYYTAIPDYNLTQTCNQWTSNRMAMADIRTGWWTPMSGGVMKWLPPYRTELGPS